MGITLTAPATPPLATAGTRHWRFADFALEERTFTLTHAGRPIALRRKPMQVLLYLLQRSSEVVTKEELAEACWPRRILSESVLATTMNRLRSALSDDAQNIVRTVHGYGYRIGVPVSVQHSAMPLAQRLQLKRGDNPPLRPLWRLSEQLGAGASADVWVAEHEKTGEKRVYKFAVDGDALRALKREITLSRVLHDTLGERPDLVRIFDWNIEQVPCFLETEFLPEGNLLSWCAAHGGLAAQPMPLRLDLMAQCAETLSAAHSVGVLHKDLKPANVLIAAADRWQVKLGDFGSGGVDDHSRLSNLGITRLGFTATRALRDVSGGTPLYVPPEAQRGQPATLQGDVYALGVMLYQAVIGDWSRPLAPGWERDVQDDLLREDIAAAVDGDPTRRFSDAAELARRLRSLEERRVLRTQQENAQRAQARLTKHLERSEIRRRYLGYTVAALMLGMAGTLVLALKLWNSEHARTLALARARQEALVSNQVTNYVVSLFDAATPENAGGKPIEPKALLQRGDALIAEGFSEPGVRARMLGTVGALYCKLGFPEACRKDVAQALAIERSRPDAQPMISARLQYWLGQADMTEARFSLAEEEMTASLKVVEASGPAADPSVATVLLGLGNVQRGQHKAAEGVATLERARRVLDDRNEQNTALYVSILGSLALGYQDSDREQDAIALGRYSMTLKQVTSRDDSPEFLEALEQFGVVMGNLDHEVEAAAALRRVVVGYKTLFGAESQRTLQAEGDFATCLMAMGHFREAQGVASAALDGTQRLEGSGNQDYADAIARVGRIMMYRGDYSGSLPLMRTAFRINQNLRAPDSLDVIAAGYDVARTLMYTGQFAEARALLKVPVPSDQTDGYAKYVRALRIRWSGELEMQAGNLDLAHKLLNDASREFASFKSNSGATITKLRESEAWLLKLQGKAGEAATQLKQVADAYAHWYPPDSVYLQNANVRLAAALAATQQIDAARKLVEAGRPVLESELAPTAETRLILSRLIRQL
ncbi:MAG TPA: winged helix-turn-helix domain-containing protein [Rhizomicrobium sp.]|nr:winged helix-turn-helix domain-containing protein [Rhizomicrobium sp.]